jgi:shikimate dehydrogenase
MKKFISLSLHPGRTGEYFYNKFFEHLGIDATYESRACDDLVMSLAHAFEEHVDGISISMPYKNQILRYLDDTSGYVNIYQSCNTVLIKDKKLTGHNTDISGVDWACKHIKIGQKITVLGNGAMASMFLKFLEEDHYGNLTIAARSNDSWHKKDLPANVVINATALGTSTKQSPFEELPKDVELVIDLAVKDNDLRQQCLAAGVKYLSGLEFYKRQFLTQFKIYTGVDASSELFDQFEREQYETI